MRPQPGPGPLMPPWWFPRLFILLLWALSPLLPAVEQVPVPRLTQRVTDLTQTLTADQLHTLETRLTSLEQAKGSQLAILLVPSTQPETIEQYAIRVVTAWKLGRQGVDDGVLLILAKADRTVRIEVGRGLEGVIPDAIANRIVEDEIIPFLKRGDFFSGIRTGEERIAALIRGEALPAPPPVRHPGPGGAGHALFIPLLGGLFGGRMLRARLGPALGGLIGAAAAAAIALFLHLPVSMAALMGLFVFVLVALERAGGTRPGGWYGGSGGFGTGGGGGGGFSGGGGGFSGGGASGKW